MEHPLAMPGACADPDIHGDQPEVESGIPIKLILDILAQGLPRDEMRNDYGITEEHIRVALRFAAEDVRREGSDAAWLAVPAG
jgi:uncharacterized protein (DUF433 family)